MTSQSSKNKSRIVLLIIVILPSMFYVMMTAGKHNMLYLPQVVSTNEGFQLDRTNKAFHDSLNHHLALPEVLYTNLETNKTQVLSQLDSKIYALQFVDMDSLSELDLALFYKTETQLAERLLPFDDIEILTIWQSSQAKTMYQKAKAELKAKTFRSWTHISIDSSSFDLIKNQAFITPMLERNLNHQRLVTIVDKQFGFRAGIDKHNKEKDLFCYDIGREYEIKLLLEDLKVLLAEEHKALKSKEK